MRSILFTVTISLLLLSGLAAADPLLTLDSITYQVQRECRLPIASHEIVDAALIHAIVNRKISEMCYDYNVIERLDTVTGSQSEWSYALNSDFLRLFYVLKITDTMVIPLQYEVVDSIFDKRNGLAGLLPNMFDPGLPRYAWASAGRLFLLPKAETEDDFVVSYFAKGAQLADGGDTTDIPEEYREALLYLVCSEVQTIRENFSSAQIFYEKYLNKMRPVKPRESEGKK